MNLGHGQVERAKVEQAKSEQMDMRKLHFAGTTEVSNQGTPEQVYELRDENDLTVVYVADPCADKELVRRWNAFPELVKALRHVLQENAIDIDWTMVAEALRNLETK